jgi:hypothetical protein
MEFWSVLLIFYNLVRGRFRVGGFAFMADGSFDGSKWLMGSGLVEGLEVRRLAERDGWGRAGVAKSYASLERFMSSYKLTVSHSYVKLGKSSESFKSFESGHGLRLGLRLKDEVRLWERLLVLIWERPIAALR